MHANLHTHTHTVFLMTQKSKCRSNTIIQKGQRERQTDQEREIRDGYVLPDYDELCQKHHESKAACMFDCSPFLPLPFLPFFPGSRLPTWPFPGDIVLTLLGLLSSTSSSSSSSSHPPPSPCWPGRSSSTHPLMWQWYSAAPATRMRSEVVSAGKTSWTCLWWSAQSPCWSTTPTPVTF